MNEEKVAKGADRLLKAFRPDREVIQVAGEAIHITELSGEQATSLPTGSDFIYRLIAATVVDKDGRRIFTDSDEDLKEIKSWGNRKQRKIIRAVLRLNGMDEETEKNSDAGPSAG
jgi:hypothetical protein